ncbi:5-hydroxytryptamine receptor 7-like [Brienomyrus brachyistius]|uniref:5-hydroxytryptamine receptor 7-like n=1 Tax=Brienomyrus brachyistius TaxID=42636 RepID=UPI0020B451C7|nr:5-hydroxytryptamine receptor 7-like [Brienomyrus brachyistius]
MFTISTVLSPSEHGHEQIYGDPTVTAYATVDPTNNLSRVEQQMESSLAEFFFIGVALSIITLVTVVGNSLVIIAVCVVKKLRQPSNYLLVSLAVADLSVALGVMPFAILTDLKGGKWIFDEVFCNIFIGMDVMCCTASILTLCVISVDRYLGITRPLTYPARQNGQLMAKMVLVVWLISASVPLPTFCGWAQNVHRGGVCLISQNLGYTIYSTSFAFYIPLLIMLVLYYKIFRAACKSSGKHQSRVPGGCSSLCHLLRHKHHSASVFWWEQKAAATLGVIVGVFSVCWLPFFILSTMRPFICRAEHDCVPVRLERTLLWLGYANSLVNPLIYAMFNRDLRSTYLDLLRCRYHNINRRLSAVAVNEALRV